jgi:hypothetical protein
VAPAIYLDVDDEITTAVARIRATGDGPAILVVPWGSRLASSRINFRLLAREAVASGRELVVVSPEPAARSLAASAGLATHATVMEYEASAASGQAAAASATIGSPPIEPPVLDGPGSIRSGRPVRGGDEVAPPPVSPRPPDEYAGAVGVDAGRGALRGPASPASLPVVGPAPRRGPSRGRVAAVLALVGILALGGAVSAAMFLPSAVITLQPASQSIGPLSLTVTADPAATAVDPARLAIPAMNLEVPVGVKGQFPATGKEVIEAKASGAVTFQNCDTGRVHTFPAGSTVKTSDCVAFVTAAAVRLDRAKINPAFACTAANVNVTAAKAGPEGNVVAGAINQLPTGFDPVVLSVVNRVATTGGTRQEILHVVQADVDAAMATLRTQLADAFAARLVEPSLPPRGTVLMTQTQRLGDAVPTPDPAGLIGKEQPGFEIALAATGTVVAVDRGPVASGAETRVGAAVASGFRLVPGSVRTTVDPPAVSGGVVTFGARVRAEQVREVDVAALLDQVRGRSIAAARTILEPYGTVRISVWPDWVTAIPTIESRVQLRIEATPSGSPPATTGPAPTPAPSPATTPRPSSAPTAAPTRSPAPSATKKP